MSPLMGMSRSSTSASVVLERDLPQVSYMMRPLDAVPTGFASAERYRAAFHAAVQLHEPDEQRRAGGEGARARSPAWARGRSAKWKLWALLSLALPRLTRPTSYALAGPLQCRPPGGPHQPFSAPLSGGAPD